MNTKNKSLRVRHVKLPIQTRFFLLIIVGLFGIMSSAAFFPLSARATTIDELNRQIDEKRKAIQDQEDKIKEYEHTINSKKQQAASLENEVAILDNSIEKTQAEIDENNKKIDLTRSEIERTILEIEQKEKDVSHQKKILVAFIVELSKRDEENPIEIWLKNNSFSDFLDQNEYLQNLQKQGQETLDEIQRLKADLDWHKQTLKAEEDRLVTLENDLKKKQGDLESKKGTKENLLAQTKNEEKSYQGLLSEEKKDLQQVNSDISNIEQQIRDQQRNNDPNSPLSGLNPNKDAIFSWPVTPLRGISTYFCDPTYPFKYLYPGGCHPAIDVPAPQGTAIRTAASGYVAKIRYTGTRSFQYALIVHDGGWTTMYGHLTSFDVSEGDFISSGTKIGNSGGAPGTIGAGTSSGAHLHFEVRKNGVAVDPLRVLP